MLPFKRGEVSPDARNLRGRACRACREGGRSDRGTPASPLSARASPRGRGLGLGGGARTTVQERERWPGGWIILFEPELHLGEDILVPDLAGWKRERFPAVPAEPYAEVAPDWVCEVLSPNTAKMDRANKLPTCARHAVRHVWLLDPLQPTLEAFRLDDAHYTLLGVHTDDEIVSVAPFEVFDLELPAIWADLAEPTSRSRV